MATGQTTADRVTEIMLHVLFQPEELPPQDPVLVEGITQRYGFHQARLAERGAAIEAIIREVASDDFLKSGGGGMSFLNLCVDRSGNQWAEHSTMQELVCLAIGAGLCGYCLPRDLWFALPGAMPYVWFDVPPSADAANGEQAP